MKSALPIFEWLSSIAERSGTFHVKHSSRKVPLNSQSLRWDHRFTLSPVPPAGPPFDLLVEGKPRLSPQLALEILPRLRENAGNAVPALCCPIISPRVAAMCRENQISYFDADGNAYLRGPGFLLDVSGRPRQYHVEPETSSDPFAPKSSRIVRVLLSAPDRAWGVLELGQCAKVSKGLASRVKDVLVKQAFLEETREGLRVRRPRELLDAWKIRYQPPQPVQSYYVMATPHEAEMRASAWCENNGIPYALAVFSGASRLAPMVRYNRATMYVDTSATAVSTKSMQESLEAKPVDTGANLMVALVDDPAIFYDARTIDSTRVVSPVQLYLDLSKQAGRGEEAAEEIFNRQLRPLFDRMLVRKGT